MTSQCCDNGESLKVPSRKPMSQAEIIFGWDRFSATLLAVLIIAFGVWWVTFAVWYEPKMDEHSEGEHGGHAGHNFI